MEQANWQEIEGPGDLKLEVQVTGEPPTLVGVRLTGGPIRTDDLRAILVSKIEHAATAERETVPTSDLPPLKRDGLAPEAFSRLVAQHYTAWAATTRKPVAAMAASQKVKLATAHTWVREARLRGHLPLTRRGKR